MLNLLKEGIRSATSISGSPFDQTLNRETTDNDIEILSKFLGVNIIIWRRTTENITSQDSYDNQYNKKLFHKNKHKLLPSFHFLETEQNVYILYKKKSALIFEPNLLDQVPVNDALYGNIIPGFIEYYTDPTLNLRNAIIDANLRSPSISNPFPPEEAKVNFVLDDLNEDAHNEFHPEEAKINRSPPIEMEYLDRQFQYPDADPNPYTNPYYGAVPITENLNQRIREMNRNRNPDSREDECK